ncbi:MAG: S8 family peptidase [Oscillospiraceae bacterium]|jgi:minor extracellular protease Epr
MNKKKKISILLVFALLFSLLPGFTPASAADSAPADAYIVRLKESEAGQAVLQSVPGLEEIRASQSLYRARSLEEVEALGSRVESVEPDYKVHLLALPNDEYIESEWTIPELNMPEVWDRGYTGKGVRVGVIDSGVNSMHEDFAGTKFDKGYNALNGSHDVTDENGHGSLVCGVIAETKDNGIGFAGLTPDVTLVPVKCFGKREETYSSYIVKAIYAAVDDYDCEVINLSLGMSEPAAAVKNAVEYAANKGVIVVSAVGNNGTSAYNYPAAYDCVIGVGSVDSDGSVSSFSQKNASVYVTAPGEDIYGPSYLHNDRYAKGSGTSFASPHVASAAAILKQYAPEATYLDFETILRASVVDRGIAGYDTSYGWGSLNMLSMVDVMEAYDFSDIGNTFPDVKGHWAEQSIRYCVTAKLFSGVTATSFEPETNMSRAMFVTVLSRMSGDDVSGFANTFSDVPDGAWYAQACNWGASAKIVTGVGNGRFAPDTDVTREQMAVFLYRYAQAYGLAGSYNNSALSGYTDRGRVSAYAKEAVTWAVSKGLISGRTSTTLAPQATAKRSEVAAILARFLNTVAA